MSESAIRVVIVEVNAELKRLRTNVCSTGNISVRWNEAAGKTQATSSVIMIKWQRDLPMDTLSQL
jgi:hypothetical protein